ncbi:MAG: ribosomal-processing cysteine protease Prp [Acutalibacteraceae bacterium]
MISVIFYNTENGDLLGFRIKGHSGYAEEGSDVICAAVSSAAQMTANTVTDVLNVFAEVVMKDAQLSLRIFQKDAKTCRDVLMGLKLHLCLLEEQYPDYISVNYTEV